MTMKMIYISVAIVCYLIIKPLVYIYKQMIKPTPEQQQKAVMMVSNTFEQYQELLQPYHNRMLAIYKELNTFTYPKKADWSTTFKVNKMHEVSNKILPRIVSRNPKWLVSFKPDLVNELEN